MTKAEKQATIDALTEQISNSNVFYIADTQGLNVEATNQLRKLCFQKGVQLKVAKNTFIKKALSAGDKYSNEFEGALKGTSAIFFSEVGNVPAKIIKEFRGDKELPILKIAYIEEAIFVGDDKLSELTKIKSKEELLGEVITLLQSPAKNVISALKSSSNTIAGLVKALEERSN
ncbi:MAG: 50S ribosomal protein L10 [Chitinophagales bacterium]|nr:50S ribosomal protein L10 [Chitinophagales bacterium]